MISQKLINIVFIFVCLASDVEERDNDDKCYSKLCFKHLPQKTEHEFEKKTTPLKIEDLVGQLGYPFEKHEIETKDGYLLTYHRIPGGKDQKSVRSEHKITGFPVLIQHGLLASSPCWLISRKFSLAFLLADAGYDVWLGNSRGNTYSRAHKYLNPDQDSQFWRFSFHEMGTSDLPAAIDHILDVNGNSQLFYIGHSMGTTMFYVMAATMPAHAAKVRAMVALAPVVQPWHIASPITRLSIDLHAAIVWLSKMFRVNEMCPYSESIFWLDYYICSNPKFKFICDESLKLLDSNDGQINRPELTDLLDYVPAGASLRSLRHFQQITKPGAEFSEYDYGYIRNFFLYYYSVYPPVYKLENISVPMYVYYGKSDWLAVPQDVRRSMEKFLSVRKITPVPHDHFDHLDFMWALDAKALLYEDILSTLESHKDEWDIIIESE